MTHSDRMGWNIMSGTWNHLRKVWGPTPDTLTKIQVSCKTQESLVVANVFTPTRHLLLAIKQMWQHDRVHGLQAVVAPASSPHLPEAMNAGGEQEIRARYTYGTPWRIRIDRTRWRFSVVRTNRWYEKRKTINGHTSCGRRSSINYWPLDKYTTKQLRQ
jgi:hypothetical protein